jgi:hypothetical protein
LGFHCLFTGHFFLCLVPFLWGKVRYPSANSLLSVCYAGFDCFSILQHHLTLSVVHWLRRWALWTAIWLISGSILSATHYWPFCLSSLCLLKVHIEISSCSFPLLLCTPSTLPPLCVPFQFLIYFIFWGPGVSLSRSYAGLSQGYMWEYCMLLICSLVGLGLPSRFGTGIWHRGSPPVFSV